MNTLKEQSAVPPSVETLPQTPFGYCHCACGLKVDKTIQRNNVGRNQVKGMPNLYLRGHGRRTLRLPGKLTSMDGVTCRVIPISQGRETIIEESDYPLIPVARWYARRGRHTWYVTTKINGEWIHMHDIVLPSPSGFVVDHIDGNGLNNRRGNLRIATTSQNQMSRLALEWQKKTSKFRGVCWNKGMKKWQAEIQLNQKGIYLGCYADEVEAAKAYDRAARKYFGEFARPNFPAANSVLRACLDGSRQTSTPDVSLA